MVSEQLVTLTFFKFQGLYYQWWALRQMQLFTDKLLGTPGLTFYKMLGSGGGNGFSILPDASTYALLLVWEQPYDALQFFAKHPYYQQLVHHTVYQWTLQLKAINVKGQWDGMQPFHMHPDDKHPGQIAVLTRATIRRSKLLSFWRHVPAVSRRVTSSQAGLVFSKGIGEIPLLQQATFSVWKDRQSMINYAYKSAHHRKVISKTKQLQWYKEELFAEFIPISTTGEWPSLATLS